MNTMSNSHQMPIFDETPSSRDAGKHSRTAENEPPAAPVPTGADRAAPTNYQTTEQTVSEDQVKAALRKVKDPELNLNILDLGLIYAIAVDGTTVSIDMSLTSPGCPSGPEIMTNAEQAIRALPGVSDVTVNLVWTPFWSPERIEPRIRAYLGL